MKKSILMIVSILSFSSHALTVKLATVDWPPYFGPKIKDQGLMVRLIKDSLKKKGHSLKVFYMPWKRAVSEATKGKDYHGLLGCWHNKEREKIFNYSQEIASASLHFLGLKDGKTKRISKLSDLKGLVVGHGRGYAISGKVKKSKEVKKFITVNKIVQLFKMIERKRIDLIMDNPLVARYEFERAFPKKTYFLKDLGPDFPAEDGKLPGGLFICWSKKNKEASKLILQFDQGLQEIKKSGHYQKLRREFGLE